jgi:mono/diheme cytochrome c family protein
MMKFLAGVFVAVVALPLGIILLARQGFIEIESDVSPPAWEEKLTDMALDARVERQAPEEANPFPPTPQNLMAGMKIYRQNCEGCHGNPAMKSNDYGASFYPKAPQFTVGPPGDPDAHLFYVVKHGIRRTAMPSWGKTLTDDQIWKVVAFVRKMKALPASVETDWRRAHP